MFRKDVFILILYMIGLHTNYFTDLIIVVRTFDLFSILREIDERFQFRGRVASFMELFKLVFFIIIFAHFIACSWHKIGILGEEGGERVTWMSSIKGDSIPDSSYDFYITSLYWAVVTMITLGYGDIVPKNQEEKLFVIFITQVSCILFAYSMNSIGEILKEMGRKKIIFKYQMGLIDTYMRKRGLNQLTQVKVRKYFEYLNKESMEDNEQSSKLISNLPQTIKEEVYSDVYGRVLNQKKIFQLHFSSPFLKELSLSMRERRLGPEEVLFKEYEISDSIYIVMKGKVQHYEYRNQSYQQVFQKIYKVQMQQRNNHILKTFVKGDLFGEIQFFGDQESDYTAVTANVTSLAVLKKQDFLDVIQRFPRDYEQYCYMKDKITLCFNIQGLDHQCVGCGNYTHTIKNCQYVNYIRNKQKILNQYTKIQEQKRQTFQRRRVKKAINTLLKQKQVYDCVVKSIFVASKTAKAQDLQEELSDMDSDLTHSYSNESIDQDPDDEMSHAAISMISSISPQFTYDFFSRTKLKRLQTRKFSNIQNQKINKTSKFARYNKEDDYNLKKQESGSIKDKSELNQSSRSQLQDHQVQNRIMIQPELAIITSRENDQSFSSQYDNILEDKNEDNQRENQSNHLLETDIIEENMMTERTQNNDKKYSMMSTEENLISKNPLISPKTAFLNLTRPRDPKLEQLKNNQKFTYLEGSYDKLEEIQESSKRKDVGKKYSIVLQNQEGDSNPSDFNIQTEQSVNIEKTNQRLHFIKGEALKNFASDFSRASSKRLQQNKTTSLRTIEHSPQFGKMKRYINDNNNPNYGNFQSQQNIPKIPLIEQMEENSILNNSKGSNSQKKNNNSQQIEVGKSPFISKDIGGFLSPISHVIESSPYNFIQFSDIGKSGFNLSSEQSSPTLYKKQQTSPQLKGLMKRINTIKFNQINEENSESSQIIQKENTLKDYSIRSPDKIEQHQNSYQNSWRSGRTSPSKKQDELTELQKYDNSPDYIKSESYINDNNPYILDFDRMKEFDLYFPEDNYEHRIAKYNQYRRKSHAYKHMIMKKKNQVRKKLAIFNKLHL